MANINKTFKRELTELKRISLQTETAKIIATWLSDNFTPNTEYSKLCKENAIMRESLQKIANCDDGIMKEYQKIVNENERLRNIAKTIVQSMEAYPNTQTLPIHKDSILFQSIKEAIQ